MADDHNYEDISLRIGGMTCAACVARVERVLQAVPGVQAASVNLATERAQLSVTSDADHDAIVQAVERAGYTGAWLSQVQSPSTGTAKNAAGQRRMLWLAVLCTTPIFMLDMSGHMLPQLHHVLAGFWLEMLFMILASIVQFGPGWQFYRRGLSSIVHAAPDMNALVMLGTSAAYGYSVVAVLAPQLLPEGADHVYFEASAVIITLVLLGRYLEGRARGRAGAAVQALLGRQPSHAIRITAHGEESIPVAQVQVGDCLRVRDGDQVPLDGTVEQGQGDVDESMITGESLPVLRRSGDPVIGGTVLTTGSLQIRVQAVGADTAVARIAAMVAQAQAGKLPIQSLVDRVTAVFVPAVLLIALVTAVLWFWLGPDPALSNAMVNAVAVLIIACPCAMGLAVPTSIMVATGMSAQHGILFRRGDALQRLRTIAVLACDKTGTLTYGSMAVMRVHGVPPEREQALLSMAAAVEQHSSHPIAQAICRHVRSHGWEIPAAESYQVRHGAGVQAQVAGQQVVVASDRAAADWQLDLSAWQEALQEVLDAGHSPVLVALDGAVAAVLAVADRVRDEAAEALQTLRDRGIRTVMISGDHRHQAQLVAQELGIDQCYAPLRPEEKVATLEQLREQGEQVAFMGDGVNDAPALAQADIGIAIGAGTDIAIEAADVVLMADDLRRVPLAVDISTATMRTIRQNVFWAFAYNTALIPVAAGALYPALGITLNPAFAALAMAASSICVVGNALRLKRRLRPAAPSSTAKPLKG